MTEVIQAAENRWSYNLVNGVAHWLVYQRCIHDTRIPEGAVQLVAEHILRSNWGPIIEQNYDIADILCRENFRGRPPQADIALFASPQIGTGNIESRQLKPEVFIEIKVGIPPQISKNQSPEANLPPSEVIGDIVRLGLISKALSGDCQCFLLICGDSDIILHNDSLETSLELCELEQKKASGCAIETPIGELLSGESESYFDAAIKLHNLKSVKTRLRNRGLAGGVQKRQTIAYLWEVFGE